MLSIILTILFLIATALLGFEVTLFLTQGRLKLFEILSISFPIGMIIISTSGSILNLLFFCTGIHFAIHIIYSIVISIILYKYNRKFRIDYSNISIVSIFGVIIWSIFFCYLSHFIFPTSDKIIKTGENDMLLEISMISSFTKGVNKKSNIFSGFQLNILKDLTTRTEILPFLYCSLIKASGCSLRLTIILPTCFLFTSICFLSFSYIYKITNSHYVSFFAAPTMLLIGGLGFINYFSNNEKVNSVYDFIFNYGSGYVNWGHPLIHNFLTSRINLTSLSLSLIAYLLLESGLYHLAGIVSIISFFVRPQSGFVLFIAFFLYNIDFDLLLKWAGRTYHKNNNSNNNIINRLKFYFIPFLILSLLFLRTFSVERSNPLWESGISKNTFLPFLSFPFYTYGIGFFSLCLALIQSRHRVFLAMFLFYFLAIVNLQTEHRFNFFTTQAVVTPLIVAAICSGFATFISLWTTPQLKGSAVTIVFFLFILMWLSSLFGIYTQIEQTLKIFGEDENDVAKWIEKNTNRNSVFAMPIKLVWNPAFARAGRVGYLGNLQALQDYKINVTNTFSVLNNFVDHPDHKIDVDYFIMKKERSNWNTNLLKSNLLVPAFNNSMFIVMTWKSSQK